ncbi:hypothetical protein D9619_010913 [Psilocybe cf. subviscida]|uniref:Rrn9 domain-containing protein n=1 Tax=Psilocybe cf. subviscida TaxID=2480587 RepID=A0A8H5EZT6_9AGAR|nr:hypothetical protein D9619_010913 [Psilocybe cf. subviscida]
MKRTWSKIDNGNEDNGPVAGPSTQTIGGSHKRLSKPQSDLRFDIPCATSHPGPSITLPYTIKGRYIQSEPPELCMELDDVEMEKLPVWSDRAQSEFNSRNPYDDDMDLDEAQILDEVVESQHPPRAPSPAATEIEDPESQDVVNHTLANGVKVRDFGFIIKGDGNDDFLPSIATTALPFRPPPEIFDQFRALAEVEYRWTQPTRRYPIAGRSARRLLDMGWLTQAEWDQRAHPMDIEALRDHNSRPYYPWRPQKWTSVPSLEQRSSMLVAHAGFFRSLDRVWAGHELRDARTREAEEAGAAALLRVLPEMKQQLESNGVDDGDANKKRRTTPERAVVSGTGSQQRPRMSSPHLGSPERVIVPPAKQYPAPLHTYNPILYPEAARIIESYAATSSQPRPVVPERADTPPLDEEEPRQQESPGRGNRLVRKKMQRGLSRTQTMQL